MKVKFMVIKSYFALFLLCLAFSMSLLAQQSNERRGPGPRGPGSFGRGAMVPFEMIKLISDEPGKQRLDVLFRIPYEFMVFVKNEDSIVTSPFIGKVNVTVDIVDSSGVPVAHEMKEFQAVASTVEEEHDPNKSLQKIYSFLLSPGNYKLITQVEDLESPRRLNDDSRVVIINNTPPEKLSVSDILFVKAGNSKNETLQNIVPVNRGGDIPLNMNFEGYFEFLSPLPKDSTTIAYRLTRINREKLDTIIFVNDTLSTTKIEQGVQLQYKQDDQNISYIKKTSEVLNKYSVWLQFPSDTMDTGEYFLDVTVRAGTQERVIRKGFSVRWYNIPRSLALDDVRFDALQLLIPKEEFITFEQLSDGKKAENFKEIWKQRDPTPATAYNEAMAEYYRRVDYAVLNYSSPKEQEGYKTDRGRTYILYGPPTKTERLLIPASPPVEVWYYNNLSKKITFTDQERKGDYTLRSVETL